MKHNKQTPGKSKILAVLVFLVLVLLSVLLIIFVTARRNVEEPASPSAVATKEPVSTMPAVDSSLERQLAEWAERQDAEYSIMVRELDGAQRAAGRLQEKHMVPASTYKIFVAYAALKRIEEERYTLETQTRTGSTIRQALEKSIVRSDNEEARGLGFLIGWDNINDMLKDRGFNNTDLDNYDDKGNLLDSHKTTTAADEADFLARLEQRELLNTDHTNLLLDLMKKQIWKERVVAGVPADVTVASKPGWLPGIQTDAAIVYGPKSRYVIVILSNSSDPAPLAALSRLVYSHLQLD